MQGRLEILRIGVWKHLADAVVVEWLDRQVIVLQTWVRDPRPSCVIILDFFSGLHGMEGGDVPAVAGSVRDYFLGRRTARKFEKNGQVRCQKRDCEATRSTFCILKEVLESWSQGPCFGIKMQEFCVSEHGCMRQESQNARICDVT